MKTLTVRMPIELYHASAESAKRRHTSLNSFILESLEAKRKETEFQQLYEGFSKLAEDSEEYDVEHAIHAQAEVIRQNNEKS
ncbi:MAG: hypothetical protein HY360_18810 [Verrucomicrobia bacterium]|nr:hypothetical protein [Verrucomicrobiota bacterium]